MGERANEREGKRIGEREADKGEERANEREIKRCGEREADKDGERTDGQSWVKE